MCYGVDVVLSYLGEVSLGHTLFWAIGGYAAANLSVKYGLNGWSTALATIVLCVVAAAFLGAVTLRTREFVFSLVTYAAAVVAYEIAFNWDAIGGSDGIVGISALKLPFGFATYIGATQEELWPVALALLLLDAGLHRAFPPLPARHHRADGSDESAACRKPRHRSAQGEAGGIRDIGADHRACRMALCLSARLCRSGYVRDLFSRHDADGRGAGRPARSDRTIDRHRNPDRAAEPAVARGRLEQDRSWLGAGTGPDLLASRADRAVSPFRQEPDIRFTQKIKGEAI